MSEGDWVEERERERERTVMTDLIYGVLVFADLDKWLLLEGFSRPDGAQPVH